MGRSGEISLHMAGAPCPQQDVSTPLRSARHDRSALGAFEPPREAHDPFGEQRLHRPGRRQLGQHLVAMQLELGRVLADDDVAPGQQPVLDRVLRDLGLALLGTRPVDFSAFLRMARICAWLAMTKPLNLVFTIYDV